MSRHAPCAPAALVLAVLLQACASVSDRVVLLPQADGRPSAVELRSGTQTLKLDQPYASAELDRGTLHAGRSSAEEVAKTYGALMAQQPPRPRGFILQFEPNGTRLTAESEARLAEVRRVLAEMAAPEVIVTGHTDRVGSIETNDRLSLQRAEAVREILAAAGVARSWITVIGRGEREPLVPTDDEVAEPRNRRVEIKLR